MDCSGKTWSGLIKDGLIKTSPGIFYFIPDDTIQSKSIINSTINSQ